MLKSFFNRASRLTGEVKRDLTSSINIWRYWLYRSFLLYRLNFQGTRLGLIWPNLSLMVVVLVLGTLWGAIFGHQQSMDFYLYLLCGFPVWQTISAAVNKANNGLQVVGATAGLPLTLVVFERLALIFIAFICVLPTVAVGVMILSESSFTHLLHLPLALSCLVLWCLGTLFLISVIVTLRPDISQLISTLMRLAFLATPIIWEPTRLGAFQKYIWLNPFFAPLEYMRYALSGLVYEPNVFFVAPAFCLSVFIIGSVVFIRYINIIRFRTAS